MSTSTKRYACTFFHSFYLLLFLIFLNNRKREHYIIQSNSVIAKIILLWILLKGCPTHVWIGHHKKYSSTHTLYLIFFGDYICIWSGPISVLFVFIVEHVKGYLRNKSWKPECVGSFNMDWRILVYILSPARSEG
jgi:hypothetical protein